MTTAKSDQLQIRVSKVEKARIRCSAARAGMDMSTWVLTCLFPPGTARFEALVADLGRGDEASYVLAALNDFLVSIAGEEFRRAVARYPDVKLTPYLHNYVAAMVESRAHQCKVPPPTWLKRVPVLSDPAFPCAMQSLRLHVLLSSPAPFRRRNIFVDSTVGDRV